MIFGPGLPVDPVRPFRKEHRAGFEPQGRAGKREDERLDQQLRDDGSARGAEREAHRDLLAPAGVLDYVVAAQPRVVLALLDYLDKIERDAVTAIEAQRAEIERMRPTHEIGELTKARDCIDKIIASKREALR